MTQREEGDPGRQAVPAEAAPVHGPGEAAPGAGDFEESFVAEGSGREERLKAELAEAQDKYLRVVAETENFKKRVARERLEEKAFAAREVVLALLPVVDNLERALGAAKAAGAAGEAAGEGPLAQLEKGVELVLRQFEDALRRQGVEAVSAEIGKPFDPNQHQPLTQVDDPAAVDGAVMAVLQKGWRMGDRLLRPCMVQVARRP